MMPASENDAKYIHILQVSWELEETFNGSLTHSQYVLNSHNKFFCVILFTLICYFFLKSNSSVNKSRGSSLVVSEYPSMNEILRDEVEEEKADGNFGSRQPYPQLVPRL